MNFVEEIAPPCYRSAWEGSSLQINVSLIYYTRTKIVNEFMSKIAAHENDWRCLEFQDFICDKLIGNISDWDKYYTDEQLVNVTMHFLSNNIIKEEGHHDIINDMPNYEKRKSVLNDMGRDALIHRVLHWNFIDIISYFDNYSILQYNNGTDSVTYCSKDTVYMKGVWSCKNSVSYYEYNPLKKLWACDLFKKDFITDKDTNLIKALSEIDKSLVDINRSIPS